MSKINRANLWKVRKQIEDRLATAGATDLTISRNATTVTVESSTGDDVGIPGADATTAGILTAAEFSRLQGIPSGGTTGQVLTKTSGGDYDTEWAAASGGGGGGGSVTIVELTSGSGNWSVPSGVSEVQVLLVGGGGGGGSFQGFPNGAGGGGAGELVFRPAYGVTGGGTVAYSVGAGGAGGSSSNRAGAPGSNTTFGTLTALGGGGGEGYSTAVTGIQNGGCGGGASGRGSSSVNPGASTASDGVGNQGGSLVGGDPSRAASGGGGAGEPAMHVSLNRADNFYSDIFSGGNGLFFGDIFGVDRGDQGWFAGGGGGGADGVPSGILGQTIRAGGRGGGGAGGRNGAGTAGIANTGGGGGGGGGVAGANGGNGGSGVILIKYLS